MKEYDLNLLIQNKELLNSRIAAYEVSEMSKDLAQELLSNTKNFVKRLGELVV